MSFRIEEKLFIKKENVIEFKEFLEKNSVKRIYHPRIIKSLYFDNVNLDMYSDSKEGLTPRKKIRYRNYPEDNDNKIYLEVKNSSVEGRFKTRTIIDKKELNQKKISGILDNQYGICYPKLYVRYKREYSIINDVRISIDNEIEYQDYKTSIKVKDDNIIVELKTTFNKNLDELVSDFPMQRIRFSKYCFAVEKLYNFN
tara:strand:+ start:1712 stop:2308 length:597 start_codon:yes stop_codon:yes gene_type:complete